MRQGSFEGKGVVYDDSGSPILVPGETILCRVADDNIYVSEGSGFWNTKILFDSTPEKGELFITNRRIVFIRKPNPVLAAGSYAYPYGIPDALANAYKARVLKKAGALEFCEIDLQEIEGLWVKKASIGILFLRAPQGRTRRVLLERRGTKDGKFGIMKDLLATRLPQTQPPDKKGTFLLGEKRPFRRPP